MILAIQKVDGVPEVLEFKTDEALKKWATDYPAHAQNHKIYRVEQIFVTVQSTATIHTERPQ